MKETNSILTDRQLANCDFVKTILMLLVILYHSCVFWNGDWFTAVDVTRPAKGFLLFPTWLNSFHIYGFTLVSGFIFAYLEIIDHYASIRILAKKKLRRLVVRYAFTCCAWVIPVTQYFYHYPAQEIVSKYILGTSPSQLWFLLMLFVVFILAGNLERFYKNNFWAAIITGVLSYGIGIVGGHFIPDIFQIWTGFMYLPIFILGYKLYQSNWICKPIIWIILHTGTFVILQMLPDLGAMTRVANIGIGFVNHIFGALMAFAVLQWIAERINYKGKIWYKILSKYSMSIYLFHQQIIYFVIWNLNGRVNTVLVAVINFCISLICSLLISFVLSRFKITRFLIGES